MEIDVAKASSQRFRRASTKSIPSSCFANDDTDISEPDTALNTPTGSMTDSFARRYSSSSMSFKNYPPHRKPSINSPDHAVTIETYEKKIQALEMELGQHVKREIELESQVLLLTENQTEVPDRPYKFTLNRMSKQVEKFLVTHKNNNKRDSSLWTEKDNMDEPEMYAFTSIIPITLVSRLQSMIQHFLVTTSEDQQSIPVQNLIKEMSCTLNSWEEVYHTKESKDQTRANQEQVRVTRLLEALHKALAMNKVMKRDHALLLKKHKADMHAVVDQVTKRKLTETIEDISYYKRIKEEDQQKLSALEHTFFQTRQALESKIDQLEQRLSDCEEERDEFETTLEMVRREMETMLEELEDTRQQKVRYKTQAGRLRAGLEAIQKKQSKYGHEEDEESEEDEGREAIRLMYNEAERQAVDLDRECKRQTLTLNSIRKELKSTEEKLNALKIEKNKDLRQLQRVNQKLAREIEMLQIEKRESKHLQQSSIAPENTVSTKKDDDKLQHMTRIHALQIALAASKSDGVIQRTKIAQLEEQLALVDMNSDFVAGLQDLFKQELEIISNSKPSSHSIQDMANVIETEQRVWKSENKRAIQKKYDTDLLQVNRELRFLSWRLNEVEEETNMLNARHKEQLSLNKYQISYEFEKQIQQLVSKHHSEIHLLKKQLETLDQKNHTLNEESLILYGRNMSLTHKLGKIDT